jgi:membrane protease YdiL (CAAX protease family)
MSVVSLPILLLVPGLMILAGAMNSIVIWLLPMSADDQALFAEMMAPGLIPLLFTCVAAPVLEEMLFRGVILRSFLRQYSRTKAILCSSLVFGIAHLNIYQLMSAFAIGIVAGWLYERCRSLWPCILLHAAYNAFVTASYMRAVEGEVINSAWYTAIAFVVAIGAGLFLLRVLDGTARRAGASIARRE